MASPLTVWASEACGWVRGSSASWNTARSAGGLVATTSYGWAGVAYSSGTYYVWEGFFDFDAREIPDTDTVTTATFSLYAWGAAGTPTWTAQLRGPFDWSPTLATDDFRPGDPDDAGDCAEYTLLATHNTTGWPTSGYRSWTSETAFLSNVSKTGTTYVFLNDARMVGDAPDAPTDNQRIQYYLADYTGTDRDPKLYVEYETPEAGFTGVRVTHHITA